MYSKSSFQYNYFIKNACSSSSGLILSRTRAKLTLAWTQAANGAAAADARFATLASNDSPLLASNCSTARRLSDVIFLASNDLKLQDISFVSRTDSKSTFNHHNFQVFYQTPIVFSTLLTISRRKAEPVKELIICRYKTLLVFACWSMCGRWKWNVSHIPHEGALPKTCAASSHAVESVKETCMCEMRAK